MQRKMPVTPKLVEQMAYLQRQFEKMKEDYTEIRGDVNAVMSAAGMGGPGTSLQEVRALIQQDIDRSKKDMNEVLYRNGMEMAWRRQEWEAQMHSLHKMVDMLQIKAQETEVALSSFEELDTKITGILDREVTKAEEAAAQAIKMKEDLQGVASSTEVIQCQKRIDAIFAFAGTLKCKIDELESLESKTKDLESKTKDLELRLSKKAKKTELHTLASNMVNDLDQLYAKCPPKTRSEQSMPSAPVPVPESVLSISDRVECAQRAATLLRKRSASCMPRFLS